MTQQYTILEEADKILQQWTTNQLVVNYEKSKDMTYSYNEGKDFLGRPKRHKQSFADAFGYYIATYQFQKDAGLLRDRLIAAYELVDIVQRARAHNALIDATQQQSDYKREIEQLKERYESLKKLNEKLVIENKRLHNLVDENTNNKKGQWEIGDVGKKP